MSDRYVIVDRSGLVNMPMLPRDESDAFLAWMRLRTLEFRPAYRIRIREKAQTAFQAGSPNDNAAHASPI